MPTVSDILAEKGNQVLTIGLKATVLEAARLMNEHKIGSLVVTEGGVLKGIITERDILRRVVAETRNPAKTSVEEVMTRQVTCCGLRMAMDDAGAIMKSRRIRHLPVVDGDYRLLGLISIGDINAYRLVGQETTIHYLHEYLYGVA